MRVHDSPQPCACRVVRLIICLSICLVYMLADDAFRQSSLKAATSSCISYALTNRLHLFIKGRIQSLLMAYSPRLSHKVVSSISTTMIRTVSSPGRGTMNKMSSRNAIFSANAFGSCFFQSFSTIRDLRRLCLLWLIDQGLVVPVDHLNNRGGCPGVCRSELSLNIVSQP